MCVAILSKPGARVSKAQIAQGWKVNSDGAGFAYIKNGEVEIEKGFDDLDKFVEAYERAADTYSATSPFLLHMRIRTSGYTNADNTHPFKIKGGAMIHNGVMFSPEGQSAGKDGKQHSDTKVFASVLHNLLDDPEVLKQAEDGILDAVGHTNKLAFLYADGRYLILNEDKGNWEDDVWFSNFTCKVSSWSKK